MRGVWNGEEFERAAAIATARLRDYVERSRRGEGPVVVLPAPEQVLEDLDLRRLARQGGLEPESFGDFLDALLERSTRLHHPASLAHQVAAPDMPAALADFVHGTINNPMAIYEMGPALSAIESTVVEWMLEHAGLDPRSGGGVLTHGGSLANLTALLAARAAAAPEAWSTGAPHDLAVLAPPSAHYSVVRSVAMLGLGDEAVMPLEVDELERIRPDRIEAALERVARAGRRPMALVAGACATGTGLHDDLEAIGGLCRQRGLWLHVDAAHGGGALVSPRHRHLLHGIEQADSVVWDAHKMLGTSSLCAAVLVRDSRRLDQAFRQHASYLFYDEAGGDRPDMLGRQLECTKAALGLKLFLNLAFRGEAALGEFVAGRYELTLRAWELIRARPGFECPYRPESNILCFRYGTDSAHQVAIRERLMAEGSFHLSSAELGGERYLRLVAMAPATDEETIERMLAAVERASAELRSGQGALRKTPGQT